MTIGGMGKVGGEILLTYEGMAKTEDANRFMPQLLVTLYSFMIANSPEHDIRIPTCKTSIQTGSALKIHHTTRMSKTKVPVSSPKQRTALRNIKANGQTISSMEKDRWNMGMAACILGHGTMGRGVDMVREMVVSIIGSMSYNGERSGYGEGDDSMYGEGWYNGERSGYGGDGNRIDLRFIDICGIQYR
jgi:hypothetical protein